MAVRVPVDTDMYWHIAAGRWMVENRAVLRQDVFSYTRAGAPWLNTHWLGQIIIFLLYSALGYAGMALLVAIPAAAGMAFVWRMGAGSGYLRAFAVILGGAAAAVFWSPRTHMFSFLLSALVLYVLHLYKREDADRLWALPVIAMLWANLHGGFIILFLLAGFTFAGEIAGRLFDPGAEDRLSWHKIGRLALWTLVAAAAIIINPFGAEMWTLPFYTFGMGELQSVVPEWQSPNFHGAETWPFVALLFGTLGIAGISSKKLDWADAALLVGTGLLAFWGGRNIATFALAATPIFMRHFDAWLEDRGWQLRTIQRVTGAKLLLNRILFAAALLAGLIKVLWVLTPAQVEPVKAAVLPVTAVEWLKSESPPGRMFNSYNWGGYLIYAYPEEAVFIDGRTDLYGDAMMRDYLGAIYLREDWEDVAAKYDIGLALIETGGLLARHLEDRPGWVRVYADDTASVFRRGGL